MKNKRREKHREIWEYEIIERVNVPTSRNISATTDKQKVLWGKFGLFSRRTF